MTDYIPEPPEETECYEKVRECSECEAYQREDCPHYEDTGHCQERCETEECDDNCEHKEE